MDTSTITDALNAATDSMHQAHEDDLPAEVAKHQPPPEGTVREFADHMDRERQGFKDWVRKELGLLVQGKSHDERVDQNP